MTFSSFHVATCLLATCLVLPPAAATAQTGNVNDCTLIKDAIALRDCILRYGNVRTQPPATIESPGPITAPSTESATSLDSEIVEVPATVPGKKPAKRSDKGAPKRPVAHLDAKAAPPPPSPPLPKPNPKDTLTHIEQIDLSKVKP